MYLFKVSLAAKDVWSQHYGKPVKPIYVVAESKESANSFAEKHLQDGLVVKTVSKLAQQLGDRMFSGD